ncbi:recombinase family protein [Neobacillus pocheonensis]|uniref:Recombinase family protein n=1 Tax=Neobacillus pocheonensis TaxID=363869 RepID=A0ABT0W6Y7_9BACI|nr:recombinase family protein [Neobacillus pocheonensis]
MRIAYVKASIDQQELFKQLEVLKKAGYEMLIQEKYTSAKKSRKGIQKLMDNVRQGDTVIVESLSRLGKSILDIYNTVEELCKMDVIVISLKENMDTATPTGKAMLDVMFMIEQIERDLIASRVKEGKESAKRRGNRSGRPLLDNEKIESALRLYDSGKWTIKDIIKMTGIGQGSLYRAIKKRNSEQNN